MANCPMCHSTQNLFFLLSYTAVIVAASSLPQPYYGQQHTPSDFLQPHDFPNESLYKAYVVIQRFKKTITCDPKNITSTWVGHDICGDKTYIGFYCAALPGRSDNNLTVASAVLNGFGLCAARLNGFIDQLPDLAVFQASYNKFGAFDIPNLAGLSYEYKLHVADDQPAQPASRRDLGTPTPNLFYLKGCLFGACAAVGLGNEFLVAHSAATNARTLLLNNNNLSGPLPANIGFSKLSYLAVANNKLIGPIPTSIGHLQGFLVELLLRDNHISGCLPHELGMLTKTAVIDAGMNQLTGPIPSTFCCLSSVEQLNLAGNRLYGDVPDALCKLAGPAGRLANLNLSGNYFTSVGLACAALIKDGVLDVKNNCIPGLANQRRPAECSAFQSQPKKCPAATTQVRCPAATATNSVAPGERNARDYSSYVTYASLHE